MMLSYLVASAAIWAGPAPTTPYDTLLMCEDGDKRMCAYPLLTGQAAPFAGELLMPALAIKIKQGANECITKLDAQGAADRQNAKINLDECLQMRQLDTASYNNAVAHCSAALTQQQDVIERCAPPWYERPWFVIPATVIATAAVTTFAIGFTK